MVFYDFLLKLCLVSDYRVARSESIFSFISVTINVVGALCVGLIKYYETGGDFSCYVLWQIKPFELSEAQKEAFNTCCSAMIINNVDAVDCCLGGRK